MYAHVFVAIDTYISLSIECDIVNRRFRYHLYGKQNILSIDKRGSVKPSASARMLSFNGPVCRGKGPLSGRFHIPQDHWLLVFAMLM